MMTEQCALLAKRYLLRSTYLLGWDTQLHSFGQTLLPLSFTTLTCVMGLVSDGN